MRLLAVSDFDPEDFLFSVAASTGVNESDVEIVSTKFIIEAMYEFEEDLNVSTIKEALVFASALPESGVNVSLTQPAEGRRLAVAVTATFTSSNASQAELALTNVAEPAKLNDGLVAAGSSAMNVVVSSTPTLSLEIVTKITSPTDAAVPMPEASELAKQYEQRSGKSVSVAVGGTDETLDVDAMSTTEEDAEGNELDEAAAAPRGISALLLGIAFLLSLL